MQSVTPLFTSLATGQVRPLKWQVRASFVKAFDSDVDFFVLNTSTLDGTDVLSPIDNNVIQEWDKYEYIDYTDRVISVEVETEQTFPFSVVQAMADITFNNYDGLFTPNSASPIGSDILPRRPFRILLGFGKETIPVFVGLTTKMPEIDKASRTAKFHCIDFLTYLFEREIDQSITLIDYSTSEILDYMFQMLGLLPTQYNLDDVSFNRINFFYAEKGDRLGNIIRPLMEAEQGRLWLDEVGVIRFKNRQSYSETPVFTINNSNVIDYSDSGEDMVINYAKIKSTVLAEKPLQKIWELSAPELISPGSTATIWANLEDPATTVVTPILDTEIESSFFTPTIDDMGTMPYADISLTSIDVFSKAVKMVFTNSGTSPAHIYKLALWGNPVKVDDVIIVEDSDQPSIDALEEKRYELETNYIQNKNNAISKAAIIVEDYKDYASILELTIKGNPALQIGDMVTLNIDGFTGNFIIMKLVNILANKSLTQIIKVLGKSPLQYFILDQSLLDGDRVLTP